MDLLVPLFVFLFGTLIGSFLNVVLMRFKKRTWLTGRSSCPGCGRVLAAIDLIPVLSYLFIRGTCRTCKEPLSLQYPVVELLTGFLILGTYLALAPLNGLLSLFTFSLFVAVMCLFVLIAVYDYYYTIIPNDFVFPLIGISFLLFLVQAFQGSFFSSMTLWHFLAGPLLYLPFYALWRGSGGRWIGLGDGKLSLAIGWMLGLSAGFSAVVLGFWVGAIVMLAIIALQRILGNKGVTMKSEVPFGPFLIVGAVLALFFDIRIISISDTIVGLFLF